MPSINAGFASTCPTVNASYVRDVIAPNETLLTDDQINLRINQAYAVIRPIIGELGECGGSTTLCEIAALLAAHFITVSERQTKRESVAGEWSVEYLGKDGEGLKASLFGQQAIAMDCSGILMETSEGIKRTELNVLSYYDIDDVGERIFDD